jgi:hypothetical protein
MNVNWRERIVKVWDDAEGDYLKVIFERKEGYFRETADDQVMEKVDAEGNVIGFSVLRCSQVSLPYIFAGLLPVPQDTLLRRQLTRRRLGCGTFRDLIGRRRNDTGATAGGNSFAADGKWRVEAQPHFTFKQFVAIAFGLRDTCGERFTFGHHRLDVDFPAV